MHDETGLSKALLRPAVKLVGTLVERQAKAGSGWLARVGGQKLSKALRAIPGYETLIAGLDSLLARFDTEIKAKQQFKDILAGRRPSHDAAFGSELTPDLQAELKALHGIDALGRQMADGFARIEGLLNPQPLLVLRLIERREESRFY